MYDHSSMRSRDLLYSSLPDGLQDLKELDVLQVQDMCGVVEHHQVAHLEQEQDELGTAKGPLREERVKSLLTQDIPGSLALAHQSRRVVDVPEVQKDPLGIAVVIALDVSRLVGKRERKMTWD